MSNREKVNITWRKPENYEDDIDLGYLAHVETWTVSGQVTIKAQGANEAPRNEVNIYIIDFDEADPFIVKHEQVWTNTISEALDHAEKLLGAYIQHISGIDIWTNSNRDKYKLR